MTGIVGMDGRPIDSDEKVDLHQKKQLHLEKYSNMVCPHCGGKLWTQAVYIKEVPGIDVGEITDEKRPYPVAQAPVFVCAKCGHVAPFLLKDKNFLDVLKIINPDILKDEALDDSKEDSKKDDSKINDNDAMDAVNDLAEKVIKNYKSKMSKTKSKVKAKVVGLNKGKK